MNEKPLIHCITNYVAMDLTANALLAVGAVPLMSFCKEEMDSIVSKCDALSVNIGCLDRVQLDAMETAVCAAKKYHKPWVLDPVGCGFTDIRTEACERLIRLNPPCIIRGNRHELRDEEYCRQLALRTGGVVAMTGETDFLTDGRQDMTVTGGDAMMERITAMGCSLSAVCAAFAAHTTDYFRAAYDALNLYSQAGTCAAMMSEGPGSFRTNFLDNLYKVCTRKN